MKIKLTNEDISRYLGIDAPKFEKYVSPIINLANRFSKGTIPKVVGQMSDLIQEFDGQSLLEWEKWYLDRSQDKINTATRKILQMLENFKRIIERIDQQTVEKWVKDLVITKTFLGLKIQEAILKKGSEIARTYYRLSNPEEESKGIDGFIGDIPVSIKPDTYNLQAALPEAIKVKMISYKKIQGGVEVDFTEVMGKRELPNMADLDLDDFPD
jgi:hypothetical protein